MNKCNIKIKEIHESIQDILNYWDSLEDKDGYQLSKSEFKKRSNQAKLSKDLGDNRDYWTGYEKGLKRRFYGAMFGTKKDHHEWLKIEDERGQGYFDGYYKV